MNVLKSLIDLGLTENQAKVYLAATELGPNTILQLSKVSGVKRTTIYSVIESLQEINLMQTELKGWKKLFKAQSPENLSEILYKRQNILIDLIPKLNSLNKTNNSKSELSYWEGKKAIKSVYNQLLNETKPGEDYLVIANHNIWLDSDLEFFEDFIYRRSKRGLKIRMLFTESPVTKEQQEKQAEYTSKIRILPANTKLTTNLVITNSQVLIHQLLPPPTAIVTTNISIIQTYQELFELLWESCNVLPNILESSK